MPSCDEAITCPGSLTLEHVTASRTNFEWFPLPKSRTLRLATIEKTVHPPWQCQVLVSNEHSASIVICRIVFRKFVLYEKVISMFPYNADLFNDFNHIHLLTQFGMNGFSYTSGFAECQNYKSHYLFRPYLCLLIF